MPSPSRDPALAGPLAVASEPPTSAFVPQAPPAHIDLAVPPSPRTHRALRRLQSAHTLGAARTANQPSLISQQRRDLQLNVSPTREPKIARSTVVIPQRARANSDAVSQLTQQMASAGGAAGRRAVGGGAKKPVFSHGHLSLQQIFRDGPSDGDYLGALESARWKVIDEGIKSADDGMVSILVVPSMGMTNASLCISLRCVYTYGLFCWTLRSCPRTTIFHTFTAGPHLHIQKSATTRFARSLRTRCSDDASARPV